MTNEELLSAIAILISIISLIYTWKHNNNRKNFDKETIMAEFFKVQYFNILTIDLPKQMNKFKEGNLTDKKKALSETDDILINIMDNSTFYKYYENSFYKKIKGEVIRTQDIVSKIINLLDTSNYRSETNDEEFEKSIAVLYKIMMNFYSS